MVKFNYKSILFLEDRQQVDLHLNQYRQEYSALDQNHLYEKIIQNAKHLDHHGFNHQAKMRLILILSLAFLGAVVTALCLRYRIQAPVNVFYYLLFIVILPLATFVVTLLRRNIIAFVQGGQVQQGLLERLRNSYSNLSLCLASLSYVFMSLITLLVMSLFVDLYFYWATTFQVALPKVLVFFNWVEWPWQTMFGLQFVDLNLLEATQFRSFSGKFENLQKATTLQGQWVLFLGATTVFYGILPRLLLFTVQWFHMRKSLRGYSVPLFRRNQWTKAVFSSQASQGSLWEEYTLKSGEGIEFVFYSDDATAKETLTQMSHNDETAPKEILVFVVDAFESPDKSFRKFYESYNKNNYQSIGILAVNEHGMYQQPSELQRNIWQSVEFEGPQPLWITTRKAGELP